MARFKPIHKGLKLLPVDFDRQVIPGSFEHALCHLVDHELDLSAFHTRYKNDVEGASAYDPAVLIKIILLAYSRGLIHSRKIEAACRENVLFIAVSGDSQPHFTTLAAFVSGMNDTVAKLFGQILLICDRQGLIGREMFAIDGVKLPANASKAKSGTRADYQRQVDRMELAAKQMLEKHQSADSAPTDGALIQREARKMARLQKEAQQLRDWLKNNPEDRKGSKGAVRKSNRTDNESAKMATSKGVIQGYTGVAAVDAKHQIIVEAQAHGTGSEQELLLPVVKAIKTAKTKTSLINDSSLITADAGYHSEANLKELAELEVDALIADNNMRSRDERFAEQDKYKVLPDPIHGKGGKPKQAARYQPQDFDYDPQTGTCICPAGKQLYSNGSDCTINGYAAAKFQGAQRDCMPCTHRDRCLLTPQKTKVRQVAFFRGKKDGVSYTDKMKARIDSPEGRIQYGQRFATVEPVFGNLRHNKQLNRFTLRGRTKVDAQWKLYCLVHNIEKLAHHGYAQ